MVSVAQLAERPPVARKVAGSFPVTHPMNFTQYLLGVFHSPTKLDELNYSARQGGVKSL
jgi:hypothetical protein